MQGTRYVIYTHYRECHVSTNVKQSFLIILKYYINTYDCIYSSGIMYKDNKYTSFFITN